MKRGWVWPLILVALLGAGLAVGGVLWDRSVSSRIALHEEQLVELGFPMTQAELEADYAAALGERGAELPIGELVERARVLMESDWPDEYLDGEEQEGPRPSAPVRRMLAQHGGLLGELREILRASGRRIGHPLDPLGDDFAFQTGIRGLAQMALWEAERRVADAAPLDEVVEAYRLVLDLARIYEPLPHTLAQLERTAWSQEVWTGIRPALARSPEEASRAFARLAAAPVEGAARRAVVPQAVLVAQVEEMFESEVAGDAGSLGLPLSGWLGWLWLRPGIAELYAHLVEAVRLLDEDDLSGLRRLDDRVRAEQDDHGELFKLLVFEVAGLLEVEIEQRDAWLVTQDGAAVLEAWARDGARPDPRSEEPGRAGIEALEDGWRVHRRDASWDLTIPR